MFLKVVALARWHSRNPPRSICPDVGVDIGRVTLKALICLRIALKIDARAEAVDLDLRRARGRVADFDPPLPATCLAFD